MTQGLIEKISPSIVDLTQSVSSDIPDDDLEEDQLAEKRLLRRLDLFTAPVLLVLYFSSFLDRVNIGNAKIGGMATDLGLTGSQYNVAVSVMYATYLACEIPLMLLFKKLKPRRVLTAISVSWSLITIFSGFIQNYGGLLAVRLTLGIVEAGLFPGLNLYLTMIYKREELAFRISFIFVAAALAGAVGGLLATGLLQLHNIGGYEGWRWLYFVEGLIGIALSIVAWVLVPDDIASAWWLAKRDRSTFVRRQKELQDYNGSESFEWKAVRAAFSDWKLYISGLSQLAGAGGLYGYSTFLPSIMVGLGFTNIEAQCLTIPCYIAGAISVLIFAIFSDRTKVRSYFLMGAAVFTITGYTMLVASNSNSVRYAAVYIVALGLYVSPALNLAWLSANMAGHYKRATSIGFNQTFANVGGIIAGQIYRSTDTPSYRLGHGVTLGGAVLGLFGYCVMYFGLRRSNALRKSKLDQIAQEKTDSLDLSLKKYCGDRNPYYRYVL